MLSGRLNSQSAIGPDTVKAYLIAVDDCTLPAVLKACEAFTKGIVEGFNNDFAPTGARLAEEARKWDEAIKAIASMRERRERLVSYPIGQLPPPPLVPLGPMSIDHGAGKIDMSKMTHAEKEKLLRGEWDKPPNGLPSVGKKLPPVKIKRVTDE